LASGILEDKKTKVELTIDSEDIGNLGVTELDVFKALFYGNTLPNLGRIPRFSELKDGIRPEHNPIVIRMRSLEEKIKNLS